jgi:hypothetical protein
VLEGAGYKVVGSGLILLSIIAQYLQCGTAMSAAAPKVAHALPALLKLYHTRAYKQVLMAGAMLPTSAGLKSISFKHLALSSQCLGKPSAPTQPQAAKHEHVKHDETRKDQTRIKRKHPEHKMGTTRLILFKCRSITWRFVAVPW